MKKMMMMAMALMVSTVTFAGDSDALKAVMKSKNYAEAAGLVKSNLSQMTDDSEKAKAYNHLVDLAMDKVSHETGIAAENAAAAQFGGKVQPYDTLGMANAICDALEMAVACNQFDQLPNAKGKVAPKFAKKNAERLWGVRQHLVTIGQSEAQKGDNAAVLRFWGSYTDMLGNPLFEGQDRTPDADYAGQVAFFAGRYAFEAKEFERASRYLDVAMKDPQQKTDALNFKLYVMRSGLKNHADSVNCINQIKAIYEQEPENDVVLDALNSMYDGMKDKVAQTALLDNHLAKYPNSFTALANKGLMAMSDNNAKEGAEWLRKAAVAKPDNAVIFTYLGACLSQLGATTDDQAQSKAYYKEAIEAFDKAKELDPNKMAANWGYTRYQAYYALYGENDPRTQAAEADK